MAKNGWASCALVLALAALPAFAQGEVGAGTEALAAESEAGGAAPEASVEPVSGRVARAGFTTQVVDREPRDSVTSLGNDATQILFFSEFSGLQGHTLTHVWERDGVEMARVPFIVDGPRWRVYSAKNLQPGWLGEWTVKVEDEQGRVLRSESFSYVAAEAQPAADEPAAPAGDPAEEPAVPAAIE
jgi:hypothetical protein